MIVPVNIPLAVLNLRLVSLAWGVGLRMVTAPDFAMKSCDAPGVIPPSVKVIEALGDVAVRLGMKAVFVAV